jgi:nitrate reductase NapAB chaperone NapD
VGFQYINKPDAARYPQYLMGEPMPVFSYIAYPQPGAKEALIEDLAVLEYCEVTPAENEEVLIIVTDTPDDETETALQEKLKQLKSLQSLGMTFGHVEE